MSETRSEGLSLLGLRAHRTADEREGLERGGRADRGDYVGQRARVKLIDARIRRGDYPSQATLARMCGVSVRTMQRDLEYLRVNMNCPLEYDPSRKGWYYTEAGRFLPATFASRDDLQALLVTGELVAAYAGTPLGPRMQAAFERVLEAVQLFPGEDAETLRKLARRICFPCGPVSPVDPAVWQAVFRGLLDERRLRLTYRTRGRGPAVQRDFDPWGILVRGRDWFLHGHDHLRGRPLTLLLPLVATATVLGDVPVRVPRGFDVREYAAAGFRGLQSEKVGRQRVVLRFDAETAELIERAPFADRQRVVRGRDGRATVTFSTNALFEVEREVLRWGEHVEVLAPAKLRRAMERLAGWFAGTYGRKGKARVRRG